MQSLWRTFASNNCATSSAPSLWRTYSASTNCATSSAPSLWRTCSASTNCATSSAPSLWRTYRASSYVMVQVAATSVTVRVTPVMAGRTVRGLDHSRGKIFLSSRNRPDRLCRQPSLLFYRHRGYFPGIKWPGREGDLSRFSAVVAEVCGCVSTQSHTFTAHRENFTSF